MAAQSTRRILATKRRVDVSDAATLALDMYILHLFDANQFSNIKQYSMAAECSSEH